MKYIDMHCDTISEIWYSRLRKENQTLRRNRFMIDLERLKKGDCLCQNLGLFVDLHRRADFEENPFDPQEAAAAGAAAGASTSAAPAAAAATSGGSGFGKTASDLKASYRFSRRRSLQTPISFPRSPMPRRSSQMTRLAACPLFCPLKRVAAARALSST